MSDECAAGHAHKKQNAFKAPANAKGMDGNAGKSEILMTKKSSTRPVRCSKDTSSTDQEKKKSPTRKERRAEG